MTSSVSDVWLPVSLVRHPTPQGPSTANSCWLQWQLQISSHCQQWEKHYTLIKASEIQLRSYSWLQADTGGGKEKSCTPGNSHCNGQPKPEYKHVSIAWRTWRHQLFPPYEWEAGSRGSPRAMETPGALPLPGRGEHPAAGMGAGDWEAAVLWFEPSSEHRGGDVGSVWGRAGNYIVE